MNKKKMFKTGLVLFLVCAISALVLSGLSFALDGKIKTNEKKKVNSAIESIAGEYKEYTSEEMSFKGSDESAKASAEITMKYIVSFEGKENLVIYRVEGKNSFGDAVIMVGVEKSIISKVEYVSFSQTNAASLIKSLPEEYVGKSIDANVLTDSYIKANYTGGTKGSRMMNLMMSLVLSYEGGEK